MKLFKTIALMSCFVGFAVAAQAGTKVATCQSEEADITVDIYNNANDTMVAVVGMESTGGSFPTYKYAVHEENIAVLGSPEVFYGKGFKLTINWGPEFKKRNVTSSLQVRSLGVNQDVICNLH